MSIFFKPGPRVNYLPEEDAYRDMSHLQRMVELHPLRMPAQLPPALPVALPVARAAIQAQGAGSQGSGNAHTTAANDTIGAVLVNAIVGATQGTVSHRRVTITKATNGANLEIYSKSDQKNVKSDPKKNKKD